ncbi:hypothetical protein D3C76_678240 [compost metagenome]
MTAIQLLVVNGKATVIQVRKMESRWRIRVGQGWIEGWQCIAQLTDAQVVIAVACFEGFFLYRRKTRALRGKQWGAVTNDGPGRFGPLRPQAAALQQLGQRIGLQQQGDGQRVQAVQADHPLSIAVASVLRHIVRAGGFVLSSIGQVCQRLALFVEQLKFNPVLYLFAAENIFIGAEGIRTVLGIVHVVP